VVRWTHLPSWSCGLGAEGTGNHPKRLVQVPAGDPAADQRGQQEAAARPVAERDRVVADEVDVRSCQHSRNRDEDHESLGSVSQAHFFLPWSGWPDKVDEIADEPCSQICRG